jgi:hypothetical protein
MVGKETGFFEKNIEKVIFLAVCVVSLALLFYFVFWGPCRVKIDGKAYTPARVDEVVRIEARKVEEKLNKPPVPVPVPSSKKEEYVTKVISPLSLNKKIYPIIPSPGGLLDRQVARYDLPSIPPIENAQLEYIKTVAYVPNREFNQETLYEQANTEVNDIDLVTVEFKFDIGSLFKAFNDSFAGSKVKEPWRNKDLAEPVIAAVQLQRQAQNPDGSWPRIWTDVPRSRVDIYKQLLQIIEDVENLPTEDIQARLLQYKEKNVQLDLLQPDSYRLASARDEWFPPSIHLAFKPVLEKEITRQRREAANAEAERRKAIAALRGTMKTAGADYNPAAAQLTAGASMSNILDTSAFDQFYKDFSKVLINEKTDLKTINSLTVWVFDDTVQPLNTYRYRVRLGVFNPIAGTDRFTDANSALKNKVILWSDYASPRQVVQVPSKLYFFAETMRDEMKKQINVMVARHKLGSWYTKVYKVSPGEAIGRVENVAPAGNEETIDATMALMAQMSSSSTPKQLDYTTGQVLLDAIQTTECTGSSNLYLQNYYQMLYSSDGSEISRMGIGARYWPVEQQLAYT